MVFMVKLDQAYTAIRNAFNRWKQRLEKHEAAGGESVHSWPSIVGLPPKDEEILVPRIFAVLWVAALVFAILVLTDVLPVGNSLDFLG
jgi:hypothetical protein